MHDSKNRKKRGPKPFAPTKKQREDVSLFAAGGMSEDGIAAEIGICRNTLRQHFADELDAGHQRELAANLKRLKKAADRGNVTAMKHLDAKFGRAAAEASFNPRPKPAAAPKLGKKEEAAEAAKTAGVDSGWGNDLMTPSSRPN